MSINGAHGVNANGVSLYGEQRVDLRQSNTQDYTGFRQGQGFYLKRAKTQSLPSDRIGRLKDLAATSGAGLEFVLQEPHERTSQVCMWTAERCVCVDCSQVCKQTKV